MPQVCMAVLANGDAWRVMSIPEGGHYTIEFGEHNFDAGVCYNV
jgi:hypothetical protein